MGFVGELSALGASLIWSSTSFIFTSASRRINAIQMNLFRLFVSTILLILTTWIAGLNVNLSFSQYYYLILSGFIGLVIGDSFLFKAFKDIGPRLSMLIASSNPAAGAILAYFMLGERLSYWSIVGITVTLTGIYLVILEKPAGTKFKVTTSGIIYAFLSALGQGIGVIFAKMAFLEGDINGFVATFVRIGSALIILIPGAWLFKKMDGNLFKELRNIKIASMLILVSILGPYVGVTLSFIAIVETKVGIATTLMSTMPVFMLPMAYLFYKEKLSWKAIMGAFIAVFGVAVLFLF